MVVKHDCLSVLDQCNGSETDAFKYPDSSFIDTEEHTLACFSRSQIPRWIKHRHSNANRIVSQRAANRTSRLSKESWYGLSIVFDASKRETPFERADEQVTTISPTINYSDQVVSETVKEPPNLLNWSEVC